MTTTYDYDLDAVNVSKLSSEILASAISGQLEGVENTQEATPALNLHVTFTAALSAGDKTTLDGLVAAHNNTVLAPLSAPLHLTYGAGVGTSSTSWTVLDTFQCAGSDDCGYVKSYKMTAAVFAGTVDVRIYDVTNGNEIAILEGLSGFEKTVYTLNSPTNIPSSAAVLELHMKAGTNSKGLIYDLVAI